MVVVVYAVTARVMLVVLSLVECLKLLWTSPRLESMMWLFGHLLWTSPRLESMMWLFGHLLWTSPRLERSSVAVLASSARTLYMVEDTSSFGEFDVASSLTSGVKFTTTSFVFSAVVTGVVKSVAFAVVTKCSMVFETTLFTVVHLPGFSLLFSVVLSSSFGFLLCLAFGLFLVFDLLFKCL
ncbi:unnamed protein product [Lymnaea stagnalis]|uniref:Uncharacterized protein n=1 Tax=Lymnaea stagnalis TaxID=6523 RepID=A0AAV2HXL9_LYMST